MSLFRALFLLVTFTFSAQAQAAFPQSTYEAATHAWNEGRLEESQLKFRMVQHSFRVQESWSNEDRQKFKITYMRLAQMSEDRHEREALIVAAYEVHSETLNNELDLFPQDIVSAVKEHEPHLSGPSTNPMASTSNSQFSSDRLNQHSVLEEKFGGVKKKWWLTSLVLIGLGAVVYAMQPKSEATQEQPHTLGFEKK